MKNWRKGAAGSDRVPRWQAERDRIHRDTGPVQRWLYKQWWMYAVPAVGLLGSGVSAMSSEHPGDAVPSFALGAMFTTFTCMAYRRRRE